MDRTRMYLGRALCSELAIAGQREWLVTNGRGGYACGTVANMATRCYHGLLTAAVAPPTGRVLLLAKFDEIATYGGLSAPLFSNRWAGGTVAPDGGPWLESFRLEGSVPVWRFAVGDALLEKRVWMEPGEDITYLGYRLIDAGMPLTLRANVLIDHRDPHGRTNANPWATRATPVEGGVDIEAWPGATPLYLRADGGAFAPAGEWWLGFDLAIERERGLDDRCDYYRAATFEAVLEPGQSQIVAAATRPDIRPSAAALDRRRAHDDAVVAAWRHAGPTPRTGSGQLALAADQFIVARDAGKTVIAGYPWFTDWGRDTMIALPGLTLATGRPEVARAILLTYARHVQGGLLPNRFPDGEAAPEYNTVDATLWYFQAIAAYHRATADDATLAVLFPVLEAIIAAHRLGTRHGIALDPQDGLLRAGESGTQLTWMDAKVDDWVVTPRMGKPVEVNALWYNALCSMAAFARRLGRPAEDYESLAEAALRGFKRFWNPTANCCFDVIDGPSGFDAAIRPNQLFAVSLPFSPLDAACRRAVVAVCGRLLLTSAGMRSLSPDDPAYIGHYGGDRVQRDGAYHQGIVWAWLKGAYVEAHLRVHGDVAQARRLLEPWYDLLSAGCLGQIAEIFDGEPPFAPRGCFAQAWSVAELLRVAALIEESLSP